MVGKLKGGKDGGVFRKGGSPGHSKSLHPRPLHSPSHVILRRDVVGGGVHLGDDDVGIVGELQERVEDISEASVGRWSCCWVGALTFSPSSLYLGSRFLQWPHHGA